MQNLRQHSRLTAAARTRLALVALTFGIAAGPTTPRAGEPRPTSDASNILFQDDFESGLGAQWVERSFPSIGRKNSFSLKREASGNHYLHVESHDSYSARGVQLQFSPEHCPKICWRWQIRGVVEDADIGRRDGDDAAAKLYVVFDGPSFWNPFDKRALVYLWDNLHPKGSILPNPWAPKRERMIVLETGNRERRCWVEECVDLVEDYSRAFPGENPARVEGLVFLADTDNTHARASASFDDLTVRCVPGAAEDE